MGAEFNITGGPPKETRTPRRGRPAKREGVINRNSNPPGMVPSVTEVFIGGNSDEPSGATISSGKEGGSSRAVEFIMGGNGKTGGSIEIGTQGGRPSLADVEITLGEGDGDLHLEIS